MAVATGCRRAGYYFVDMEEYMRFYLGTTDADEMPRGAVVEDSHGKVFGNEFLSDKRIGAVVVCVHGFNVELFEAFTWFRILTDTMRHIPAVEADRIVTSPADLATRKSAEAGSLTAFIGFLLAIERQGAQLRVRPKGSGGFERRRSEALLTRLKLTVKSVNLICHSMGNFVACHTFAALVNKLIVPAVALEGTDGERRRLKKILERAKRPSGSEEVKRADTDWLIDSYVMIAPDVERRHVTKCAGGGVETDYVGPFYSGLQHLVHRKINFYSRFDNALAVSDLEKAPREMGLAIGDAASKLTLGLLDFLKRNPDQRWEKRLGEAPAPVNAAPGFTSVNATELANRKIGHSDHIDARPVVEKIAEVLGLLDDNDG